MCVCRTGSEMSEGRGARVPCDGVCSPGSDSPRRPAGSGGPLGTVRPGPDLPRTRRVLWS